MQPQEMLEGFHPLNEAFRIIESIDADQESPMAKAFNHALDK